MTSLQWIIEKFGKIRVEQLRFECTVHVLFSTLLSNNLQINLTIEPSWGFKKMILNTSYFQQKQQVHCLHQLQ